MISDFEFSNSPMDIALLRNISKVAAAAHMPFIGSVGPAFLGKQSMEEVAAIQDIGNYFDRAEYIKWKSFRDMDDARYVGLTMPRVLGRLPYGKDTVPVRAFNYEEAVKGPDHNRYLWVNASFAFAANMTRSFVNNGVVCSDPRSAGWWQGRRAASSPLRPWDWCPAEDPDGSADSGDARIRVCESRFHSALVLQEPRLRVLLLGRFDAERPRADRADLTIPACTRRGTDQCPGYAVAFAR